jgi:hypothetical protein
VTGSIGLPEFFMDESKWQLILLVYFGLLIFVLPILVWRWCRPAPRLPALSPRPVALAVPPQPCPQPRG